MRYLLLTVLLLLPHLTWAEPASGPSDPKAPTSNAIPATASSAEQPQAGAGVPQNHQKALLWNRNVGTPPDPAAALAQAGLTVREHADTDPAAMAPPRKLTLSGLIGLITGRNQQLQSQQAQWGIYQAEADKARAIFEPDFVASAQLEDRSQKNTVEEAVSRQFESIYAERNWDTGVAVEGLLPTGAKLSLGYNYRRLSNTLTRDLTNQDQEHQMFLGATLTQPLLKNAGIAITRSGIAVAEAEADVAFQEYRRETMRTVGEAAATYWSLFQAQEKQKLREESIEIAEQILKDSRERLRNGKMAQTDVLEARAGVATRRSLQSEARQEHLEATNRLRTLFALAVARDMPPIEAVEKPVSNQALPDYPSVLKKATELRPEYLAAQKRVERSGIKLAYARNQSWPELDLKASYGLNGLDFDSGDAWEQIEDHEHKDWSVGLKLRLPLQGNREGEAEVHKSKLEQKRALLDLKSIEVELANGVDTALHQVASAAEQFDFAKNVVEIHQQLLEAEMARLDAGKSNSRLVLEKEENYRKAQEVALKNMVNLQKALVGLEIAGGTVLTNHGVEIMEVGL